MKTTLIMLFAAAAIFTAAACHNETDKPAAGPMERAGRKIDETADKAANDAKDAKATIKAKARDAGL